MGIIKPFHSNHNKRWFSYFYV